MAAAKAGARAARDDAAARDDDAAARDDSGVRLGDVLERVPRTSPGYVRAVSPEGEQVVFVPGELLPDWAAARLAGARLDEDATAWRLPASEGGRS